MLFASSADLEWNDWAKDPSYVVAMLEIAQYLARSSAASRTTVVGRAAGVAVGSIALRADGARPRPGLSATGGRGSHGDVG